MAPEHHLEVYKGRAGCFRFVKLALGFELPQSCSAAVWHSNTSTPCPQAPDTIWFHSDDSRFMFSIVSWMSTYISIATFHVRQLPGLSICPCRHTLSLSLDRLGFKLGTLDVWLLRS